MWAWIFSRAPEEQLKLLPWEAGVLQRLLHFLVVLAQHGCVPVLAHGPGLVRLLVALLLASAALHFWGLIAPYRS